MSALAFVACGDDDGVSKHPDDVSNSTIDSADSLGVCDEDNDNDSIYVSSEDQSYRCQEGTWEKIPNKNEDEDPSAKSSSSQKTVSSSSKKNDSAKSSSSSVKSSSSSAKSSSSSKVVEESSSSSAKSSSSSAKSSSSSEEVLEPGEKTYAFGYALKNAPHPSAGCGKNSTLVKTKSVENGDRFEMMVEGLNREYFITLPKNYDKSKPYKLLFAMHFMSSNAEDMVHHYADAEHPTPYYGQQVLDTENNYIFVAPRGDSGGGVGDFLPPWRMTDDKDHKFFDKLLTTMEDNYCIDTTRVFVTGFSFGSMFTYSLAEEFQDRIRAVVTYAMADNNIYEPHDNDKEKQLPIAWMNVHGKNDGTCPYDSAYSHALPRVLKNNGKASDGDSQFTDASSEKPEEVGSTQTHVCYDFKTVDERFPVKWCSWNGPHKWTAYDGPIRDDGWKETWVPKEVHKFFEQF